MKSGSRIFKNLAGLTIPFFLGAFHYLAMELLWLKLLFLLLSVAMLWLVWDSYSRTSWDVIYEIDSE